MKNRRSAIDNFLKNKTLLAMVIVVLGFTAYSFMLSAPFKIMDDQMSIVTNQDIKGFSNAVKIFRSGYFGDRSYYRPLVLIGYMVEHYFFGLNPFFYNLTNVLVHLGTALIIFFLIARIFQDRTFGFFVGLLFAIHPVQWEAVSNIAGRSIVLCTSFTTGAFFLFYLSVTGEKRVIYYGCSLACFIFALLSKEPAVVFPFIILSYEWLSAPGPRKRFKSILIRTAPFFAVAAAYFAVRRILGMTAIFRWDSARDMVLGVMTFLRALMTSVRLFIMPVDLHFDRARMMFGSFADPALLLTLLFYAVVALAFFKFRKKLTKQTLFFLSWFLILLLPVAQIIPVCVQPGSISTAEHFLYLPSLGILVLIVLLFRWCYRKGMRLRLFSKTTFGLGVIGLYLCLLSILIQQNIYSRNEITMLGQSVYYEPRNARVQFSLGLAYAQKQLYKEAEERFRKALETGPENIEVRIGLGKALCDQGRYSEGMAEYEKITDAGRYAPLLQDNMRLTRGLLARERKAR